MLCFFKNEGAAAETSAEDKKTLPDGFGSILDFHSFAVSK